MALFTRSSVTMTILMFAALAERSVQQIPGGATASNNFNPATITVNSGPFEVIATPITPNAPYSQAALQCNVSGDSRIPGFATYPLTVKVTKGQIVRVIFANGNLGGATVTQQGEPGVIVQQGGVIVQQAGSASPIVQNVTSPVVQQPAPPSALVVQQGPTAVVQQPQYQQAPTVQQYSPPPTSPTPPANNNNNNNNNNNCGQVNTPVGNVNIPCNGDLPNVNVDVPKVNLPNINLAGLGINLGRKLLQETVPGGPNNGLVEYVALAFSNNVPGFVVPNTQFGVPYVEFSASDANVGQTASFSGVLEVAQVVNGVPLYPFTPNPRLSPECQVNINLQVA